MGTRAVLTFKDRRESFNVYHHYDGYPEHILPAILAAKEYAWQLPRFEAADFAAAFIAANKQPGGGNVYFTDSYKSHGDLEYRYEVEDNNKKLAVKIYEADYYDDGEKFYKLVEEMDI